MTTSSLNDYNVTKQMPMYVSDHTIGGMSWLPMNPHVSDQPVASMKQATTMAALHETTTATIVSSLHNKQVRENDVINVNVYKVLKKSGVAIEDE